MLIHEKIPTRDLSIYFLTFLAAVPLVVSGCIAEPVRFGYIEKVWVESLPINLDAKLDTGAETSSLSAIEIRTFQINREDWVSFLVPLVKDRGTRSYRIKRPIARVAKIRRAGATSQLRPVVRLSVCVGGMTGEAEFTLVDRRAMAVPVLLGRNFLANRIVVDSSLSYSARLACH